MDYANRDIILTVGTSVLLLVGVVLIFIQDPTLTVIGIVLVSLSGIIFVVDVKDILATTEDRPEK